MKLTFYDHISRDLGITTSTSVLTLVSFFDVFDNQRPARS